MTTGGSRQQRGGHDLEFAALLERHERELHVHCYRMLASFEEAEDALPDLP